MISAHGYDEMAEDDIPAADVLNGVAAAVLVEDYPDAIHGPSVLVLQRDAKGGPLHIVGAYRRAVWGRPYW